MGFDVLFSLILAVVDLSDLILKFLNKPEGMSFGIILIGTEGVADIVIIVSDIPYPIGSF